MVRRPDTESSEELYQSQNAADERRQSAQADGEEEEEESEVERTQVARGLLDGDGEEEEEEEEENNDDDDEGGSTRDRKRARLENGDIKDEEVRVKAEKPPKVGMLPRHADGYVQIIFIRQYRTLTKNVSCMHDIDTFLAQLCE